MFQRSGGRKNGIQLSSAQCLSRNWFINFEGHVVGIFEDWRYEMNWNFNNILRNTLLKFLCCVFVNRLLALNRVPPKFIIVCCLRLCQIAHQHMIFASQIANYLWMKVAGILFSWMIDYIAILMRFNVENASVVTSSSKHQNVLLTCVKRIIPNKSSNVAECKIGPTSVISLQTAKWAEFTFGFVFVFANRISSYGPNWVAVTKRNKPALNRPNSNYHPIVLVSNASRVA